MIICPNCLAENKDGSRFCHECGGPLTAEEELVPAEAPEEKTETPAPPAAEEPVKEAPAEERPAEERPAEEKPAEERPAEERKTEPEAPKKKEKLGLGRRFLAGLLCVFLLAFLLVCASAWMLRLSTGREGLERALTHVDLAELRVDPFFEDVDEPTTASELLSEELAPVGLKLDRKTTARLLNSEPVRDFLADQLAPLCDDVYRGRTRYEYEPKELDELLTGSRLRRVMKEEGVFLSTEEAAGVSKLLADYGLGELLNRDTLREQEPDLVRAMYLGLSWVALGVLAALTLLLAVLVAVTDRGRAPYFLRDLGGTAAVGGGLLSLAALLAGILPRLWVKICGGEALAAVVSRAVLLSHLGFCLGLLALGVLMLLHSRFLRRRES